MTNVSKGQNTLPCVTRNKVCLTDCFGGNPNGDVVLNLPFTYYFENGRVNRNMLIECEGPSGVLVCELFMGRLKIRIRPC
jgi:hypothetical protein